MVHVHKTILIQQMRYEEEAGKAIRQQALDKDGVVSEHGAVPEDGFRKALTIVGQHLLSARIL